jgi:hypothetical protein
MGISRLFIKIIFFYGKKRKVRGSFTLTLFLRLDRNDKRLIMFIDGIWYLNGSTISHVVKSSSPKHIRKDVIGKLEKLEKEASEMSVRENTSKAKSEDSKFFHKFIQNITQDSNNIAYQTDYSKAQESNNYGKDVLINKFEGEKKKSILLEEKISNMKEEKEYRIKNTFREIDGAGKDGYSNKMKENFKENVEKGVEINKELDIICEKGGINFSKKESMKTEFFKNEDIKDSKSNEGGEDL